MKPGDGPDGDVAGREAHEAAIRRLLSESRVAADPDIVARLLDERLAMIAEHADLVGRRRRGLVDARGYAQARRDGDRRHREAHEAILGPWRMRKAGPVLRAFRRLAVAALAAAPGDLPEPRVPAERPPPRRGRPTTPNRADTRARAAERTHRIARLVGMGESQAAVARKFGISRQKVGALLDRHRASWS